MKYESVAEIEVYVKSNPKQILYLRNRNKMSYSYENGGKFDFGKCFVFKIIAKNQGIHMGRKQKWFSGPKIQTPISANLSEYFNMTRFRILRIDVF